MGILLYGANNIIWEKFPSSRTWGPATCLFRGSHVHCFQWSNGWLVVHVGVDKPVLRTPFHEDIASNDRLPGPTLTTNQPWATVGCVFSPPLERHEGFEIQYLHNGFVSTYQKWIFMDLQPSAIINHVSDRKKILGESYQPINQSPISWKKPHWGDSVTTLPVGVM